MKKEDLLSEWHGVLL